jgi:hypothetical protein
MRILLTGFSLSIRAGHEVETLRLARSLQDRGHVLMVSGSHPAQLLRTLEIDMIPLVADPSNLVNPPDIIHACHLHDAFWAMAALPDVPAVLQSDAPETQLVYHPRIHRRLRRLQPEPAEATGSPGNNPWRDEWLPEDEESMGSTLERIYPEVIAEHRKQPVDEEAERLANLRYLRHLNTGTIEVHDLDSNTLLRAARSLWSIAGNAKSPTESGI